MSDPNKQNYAVPVNQATWYMAARATARISAVFCVLVFGLLLVNVIRSKSSDPVQPVRIEQKIAQLNKDPNNAHLRAEIRQMDRKLRVGYFRGRAFSETGMLLLLTGVVVFLVSTSVAAGYERKAPAPDASGIDRVYTQAAQGRRSVVALGTVMGGVLLMLVVLSRHDASAEYARAIERPREERTAASSGPNQPTPVGSAPAQLIGQVGGPLPGPLPGGPSAPGGAGPVGPSGSSAPLLAGGGPVGPAPVGNGGLTLVDPNAGKTGAKGPVGGSARLLPAFPSVAWAANWPMLRGPGGNGVAIAKDVPAKWDGAKGEGVVWKTPLALPGWNSPVVWGDRVFLTGADKTKREVYCFDANKGSLVWQREVANPAQKGELNVSDDTGYAPNTMVADGKRVYALFVNGDIACFDFTGKPAWSRRMGTPINSYGHAASLAMWRDRLIVQYDQGSSPTDGKSFLLALDSATGKDVWVTPRPVPNSWSTPLVVTVGKQEQIITCANPLVIAYNPADGKEIWRATVLGGEVAPSPTFGGNFVLVCNLGANLAAISPDGSGDVTKTKVAWMAMDGLPDITSPASNGSTIMLAGSEGGVTCYDVKKGTKLWNHNYDDGFRASPVYVGKSVYLLDQKGVMHIVDSGAKFKELAALPLGEAANSTPAFVNGRIYIRGAKHLYCIGAK